MDPIAAASAASSSRDKLPSTVVAVSASGLPLLSASQRASTSADAPSEGDTAAHAQVGVQERGAVAVAEGQDDEHPIFRAQIQIGDDRLGVRRDVAVRHADRPRL